MEREGVRFEIVFGADQTAPVCTFRPQHGVRRGVGSGREAAIICLRGNIPEGGGRRVCGDGIAAASLLFCGSVAALSDRPPCFDQTVRTELHGSLLIILVKVLRKILAVTPQELMPLSDETS